MVSGALAAVALILPLLADSTVSPSPEDELKSAAVLSFLRYSDWRQAPGGAVTVGVFGRSAISQALAHTLEGKQIQNHPVHLLELGLNSDARGCQLVYVAAAKAAEVRQIVTNAVSAHALTIGETDRFLEYGGAVNLFLIDGHIGFEVSLDALGRAGVTISPSLLRLGQIRDQGHGRSLH